MGVLVIRALLSGVYIGAPDFWNPGHTWRSAGSMRLFL